MAHFWMHKFGRNADVDASEDVWDFGSHYLFPLVAFPTEIVGGASDIPSSDGVHSVCVEGLDINGVPIVEVATMNGTTPVVLVNSFYRVNRAFIDAMGGNATQVNSFNIDVTHQGSAMLAQIRAEEGQTNQAIYTMPKDVNGTILAWNVSASRIGINTAVSASIKFQTRFPGRGWRTRDTAEVFQGVDVRRTFNTPESISLPPLTDIRVRVTDINTTDVAVSAGFEISGVHNLR
jgi:hypothetical protein